jgi:hypothetical protein
MEPSHLPENASHLYFNGADMFQLIWRLLRNGNTGIPFKKQGTTGNHVMA